MVASAAILLAVVAYGVSRLREGRQPVAPDAAAPATAVNPAPDLEEVLRQFEENFNELLEARKAALEQTRDGIVPPEAARNITRLEARDRELRELTGKLSSAAP
jgi:hypothetical protein